MLATRPQPSTASKRSKQFTRTDYHAMGRAGILTAGDRVELLEGEIIVMSPIGTRHASCVDRLTHALTTSNRLAGRALVRVQSPLAESDRSEPQPDLMLLALRDDWYAHEHPGPADVLLLVEVADSSLDYDRDTKIPTYAAAGIREVWLVDLEHDRIEVYTEPARGDYRVRQRAAIGDAIAPEAFPDLQVDVAGIIPARSAD